MKKTLTRLISFALMLAMLCSMIVLPVSAENSEFVNSKLTFTNWDGTELGTTIEKDTELKVRLVTEKTINVNTVQLAVAINSSKVEFAAIRTNKYADTEVTVEGDKMFNVGGGKNTADAEGGRKIATFTVNGLDGYAAEWPTSQAIIYFKLKVLDEAGIATADLSNIVELVAKNSESAQTVYGVTECRTFIKNDTLGVNKLYTSNYNVCPCVVAIGHKLGNNAYDTQVTVDQLRQNLSFGAYEASGAPAGYNKDNVRIYTDSSKETELDDTAKLSECLNGTSGEYATGNLYIEVTTTTGLTLGKTTEIRLKKDEVTGFELKPASGGFTFTYNDNAKSFELDDDSFTIEATYKSGAKGPMTGSVLHGKVNAGTGKLEVTLDGTNFKTTIDYNIEKHRVTVPQITGGALSYNGAQQKANIWQDDLYTISDDTATDAGPYAATVTLKDPTNVRWDDTLEDTATRTVDWKIERAKDYAEITQGTDQKIYTSTPVSTIVAGLALSRPDGSTVPLPTNYTIAIFRADSSTPYGDTDTLTESDTYWVTLKPTGNDAKNYEDVSSFVSLTVQEREIVSIRLQAGHETPDITQYYYRDSFTSRGLVIEAVYKDGGTGELDLADFEWSDLNTVGRDVTVTGTLKGTNFKVEVSGIKVDRRPISVTVKLVNESDKHLVYDGTDREPKVKVTFQITAGKTEELTLGSDYTVSYNRNRNVTSESLPAEILVTSMNTSNYNISGKPMALFYIDPKPVTISGVQSGNKVFDGTTTASVTGSAEIVGKVENDDVSVTGGAANFDSAFVNATKVEFSNFSLSGDAAKNYTLEKQPDPVSAKITTKALTLNGLTVEKTRQYDGTNVAKITSWGTLEGIVSVTNGTATEKYNVEIDTANSKATFDSAAVGNGKTITFSGFKLTGTYADNYTLAAPANITDGEITKRTLTGNTQKTGTLLMHGEDLFDDPTIDGVNNEKVTGSFKYSYNGTEMTKADISSALRAEGVKEGGYNVGFTFTPDANGNYTGTVTGTLTITVQDVTFKRDGVAVDNQMAMMWLKDGIEDRYAAQPADYYVHIIDADKLEAYVGEQKVEGTYYYLLDSLTTADASKAEKLTARNHDFKLYFIANDTATYPNPIQVGKTYTMTLKQAQIQVKDNTTGITVDAREYDGTTNIQAGTIHMDKSAFTVSPNETILTAVPADEKLELTYTTAAYNNKNAGDRTVTLSGLSLGGTDAGNYSLLNTIGHVNYHDSVTVPAKITPKDVTISGTTVEATKVYDGDTTANIINNGTISGKIDGDSLDITAGSAAYDNKNVGTGKTVTFSDFSLKGADKDNYNLTKQPDSVQANITAKELHITNFTVKDKVYDGNNIAEIVSIETDAFKNDDVRCQYMMARFDTANAGTAKAVTLSYSGVSTSLTGEDAGNYALNTTDLPTNVTATIHKANLTGAPTFTKITQSGKTLHDIQDSDVDLTAIHGVLGEPNPLYPVLTWGEDRDTVIQANRSYSWEVKVTGASADNYLPLTGSVVLYPVSTGYSEQVKKQIEEFEAKKRGELPESDTTFRDVSEDDYFFDAVNWAAENGITGGVSANRFGPTQDCSRGQTMTFLWRAMGEPEPASRASDLTDVMTGSYYYDAVLWAMEAGITTGAGANRFAPDATVTRGQFVTFLYRLANASSDGVHPFTDVPAGSYYEKAIAWAYAEGITKGTGATTFSPDAPCTRAQIITFLYRYFNR